MGAHMICPVEIASDMSALRAVRIGDHAEHGSLSESRDGASDESAVRNVAGDGEEDHVVASGGDSGHQRPSHAALSGTLRRRGYNGLLDRRRASPRGVSCPWRQCRRCSRSYQEKYFDLNVQHFHEKFAVRALYRTELHLREAGPAGSGPRVARTQARRASQAARAAAVAVDAVAYRLQPPPVVSGRTLVRPDRDSGRCH